MADRVALRPSLTPVNTSIKVDGAGTPAAQGQPQPAGEIPLAPASIPRSNVGSDRDRGISVNAVVLGLVAVPAALMGIIAPSAGEAHAATRVDLPTGDTTSAEALARGTLFAANTSTQDPNVRELVTKITRLVQRSFHGDGQAAFNHYAGADGKVNRDELSRLLSDAGIGNMFTRGAWVSGIMERVDASKDGKISWSEFQAVMASAGPQNA